MNRRGTLGLIAAGVVAAAAGFGVNWWRTASRKVESQATSALFAASFPDVEGVTQALSQWQGRPLVVNFWATWCPPCVAEMPDLQRVRDEYRSRGIEIIGLGIDSAAKIAAFRDRHALTLPLLVAGVGGSDLYRMLGNQSGVLPFTVLIGAEGRVLKQHVGQVPPELLRRWLDESLGAG